MFWESIEDIVIVTNPIGPDVFFNHEKGRININTNPEFKTDYVKVFIERDHRLLTIWEANNTIETNCRKLTPNIRKNCEIDRKTPFSFTYKAIFDVIHMYESCKFGSTIKTYNGKRFLLIDLKKPIEIRKPGGPMFEVGCKYRSAKKKNDPAVVTVLSEYVGTTVGRVFVCEDIVGMIHQLPEEEFKKGKWFEIPEEEDI